MKDWIRWYLKMLIRRAARGRQMRLLSVFVLLLSACSTTPKELHLYFDEEKLSAHCELSPVPYGYRCFWSEWK